MMQHFNYSLGELDSMIPWEREIYVGMLDNYIKEENERLRRESEKRDTDERRNQNCRPRGR